MNLKTTLTNALRLLEERGWCQGANVDPNGSMCMQGAIYTAVGAVPAMFDPFPLTERKAQKAMNYLKWRLGGVGVPTFNDLPGRTWESVQQLLKEAIAFLDTLPDERESLEKAMQPKRTTISVLAANAAAEMQQKKTQQMAAMAADSAFHKHILEHQKLLQEATHKEMWELLKA